MAVAPPYTMNERIEMMQWGQFYKEVKSNNSKEHFEALGRLVGAIDSIFIGTNAASAAMDERHEASQKTTQPFGDVSETDLLIKITDYITRLPNPHSPRKEPTQANRYALNTLRNIQRVFEYQQEGKPEHLLPQIDRRQADGLVGQLRAPPTRETFAI